MDTILGFDISTSVIGYCFLDLKGEVIELDFYKFQSSEMLEKGNELKNLLNDLNKKYKITSFFLEDRLKAFAVGKTNSESLFKLASINYLCQYLVHRQQIPVKTLNVNAARSSASPGFHKIARTMKGVKHKEIIFTFVRKELGDDLFPKKEMKSGKRKGETVFLDEAMDMADAYVIAKAGLNSLKLK